MDLLENGSIVTMLLRYPEEMPAVAAAANVFAVVKLALTPLELVFVIGLLAGLIRSLRQRALQKAASS